MFSICVQFDVSILIVIFPVFLEWMKNSKHTFSEQLHLHTLYVLNLALAVIVLYVCLAIYQVQLSSIEHLTEWVV